MSLRRPPRGVFQRLRDGTKAQRVGGAGLVYNAAPVSEHASAVAQALQSVAAVTDKAWKDDIFVLASDGPQDLTLTYLPLDDENEDVKLQGLGQLRGVDWQRSGQILSILSPMDAVEDQILTAQYWYLTGMPVAPSEEITGLNFVSDKGGLGPTVLSLPAATVAGSVLVLTTHADVSFANPLVSVTGHGATWAKATGTVAGANGGSEIWIGTNPTPGTGAVTITQTNGSYGMMCCLTEWTGLTGTVLDADSQHSTGTSPATPSVTGGASAKLVVSAIGWLTTSGAISHSDSPVSWATQDHLPGSASSLETSYLLASGAVTASRGATIGSSVAWAASAVVLA